jgi:hypothetical protein
MAFYNYHDKNRIFFTDFYKSLLFYELTWDEKMETEYCFSFKTIKYVPATDIFGNTELLLPVFSECMTCSIRAFIHVILKILNYSFISLLIKARTTRF